MMNEYRKEAPKCSNSGIAETIEERLSIVLKIIQQEEFEDVFIKGEISDIVYHIRKVWDLIPEERCQSETQTGKYAADSNCVPLEKTILEKHFAINEAILEVLKMCHALCRIATKNDLNSLHANLRSIIIPLVTASDNAVYFVSNFNSIKDCE